MLMTIAARAMTVTLLQPVVPADAVASLDGAGTIEVAEACVIVLEVLGVVGAMSCTLRTKDLS